MGVNVKHCYWAHAEIVESSVLMCQQGTDSTILVEAATAFCIVWKYMLGYLNCKFCMAIPLRVDEIHFP